ncbi:hypothetical protein D9M71_203900 [compost metagenome]
MLELLLVVFYSLFCQRQRKPEGQEKIEHGAHDNSPADHLLEVLHGWNQHTLQAVLMCLVCAKT